MKYTGQIILIRNCKVKQVSRPKAQRVFDEGEFVYVCASNEYPTDSIIINKRIGSDNFTILVNRYMYYNCNLETGKGGCFL